MLLFNFPSRKPSHKFTGISIHFMLLFNGVYEDGFQKGFIFQYIICCYSTNTILFNFIKSRPFQYILCYYSTLQAEQLATIFQYVLCYYSTCRQSSDHVDCVLFQYILCYYSTNEKPSFLYLTDLYKSRS